ncbi:MAG: hypothetical protein GC154_00605 [bacterium]|nr:hypothetical protein [bacterium]
MNNTTDKRFFQDQLTRTDLIGLAVLFILALLPRLMWSLAPHPAPFSDMEDYYRCALGALNGGYLAQSADRLAYRAPGYPIFLAALSLISPGSALIVIRFAQSILGALTAVNVYLIARILLLPVQHRPAPSILKHPYFAPMLAGLAYAFQSHAIFFTGVLMSETFYLFALTGWLVFGLLLPRRPTVVRLSIFSAGLGALALIRPVSLFFLPVVVFISLASIPRDKWSASLWAPMLAWAAPILPWTIRNAFVLHALVLITTNSGVNFYIGQHPQYSYWYTGDKEAVRSYLAERGEVNEVIEDRFFFRLGLYSLWNYPIAVVPRSVTKLTYLYILPEPPWPWAEYYTIQHGVSRQGLYFDGMNWFPLFGWSPILLLLALTGMAYAWVLRLRQGLPLTLIGLYTFACLVYFARTRFRMPLDPLLLIYAVTGAASLVDGVIWGYGNWLFGGAAKSPAPERVDQPEDASS